MRSNSVKQCGAWNLDRVTQLIVSNGLQLVREELGAEAYQIKSPLANAKLFTVFAGKSNGAPKLGPQYQRKGARPHS